MHALLARGETLSSAESCTGGLIAKVITDIPGSSAALMGACVTYTNEVKINLLGVDPEIIVRVSEVSFECAEAMATGAKARMQSTYAVSTTGYAGPGGGTEKDPVGTVYIAVDGAHGTVCRRLSLSPLRDRAYIRMVAATNAILDVLHYLESKAAKNAEK